jgi:myo-inositol-1-phosphate synthase
MGVTKDEVEAVKWYGKAAEQGYAEAQYNLGCCYANGTGVTKDEVEAVKWFRKAAGQGYAEAQYNLGLCYANGTGVAKDEVEAYALYSLAGVSYDNPREARDGLEKVMSLIQIADGKRRTKELQAEFAKSKGE